MEEQITKTLIESQYPLWKIILLFIVIQLIIILCSEWIKKLIEKQAISGITNKIKDIETKFTNQTEELKSQLSILTNIQTDISAIERDVIIDFNKHLFSFVNFIAAGIEDCTNNNAIDFYVKKLYDFGLQTANCLPLLTLFVENENLCQKASDLLNLTLEMEKERCIDIIKLKMINTEITAIKDPIILENKNNKRINFINEMFTKTTQRYESNKNLICGFQQECREYISRLLKKSVDYSFNNKEK